MRSILPAILFASSMVLLAGCPKEQESTNASPTPAAATGAEAAASGADAMASGADAMASAADAMASAADAMASAADAHASGTDGGEHPSKQHGGTVEGDKNASDE